MPALEFDVSGERLKSLRLILSALERGDHAEPGMAE
jgi:hypothetical protein